MFELKVLTHFAAAHQLQMVSEKCENLHGHNWKIEVCVAGDQLDEAGVLMDFGRLKAHVKEIIDTLDHQFLNEIDVCNGPPSSENIAVYIAKNLQTKLSGTQVRVCRVTAWESDNAAASYIPE
jgi:6-pyruvoyltetrahydropterin/6-carboxytetrahydropterin synthase